MFTHEILGCFQIALDGGVSHWRAQYCLSLDKGHHVARQEVVPCPGRLWLHCWIFQLYLMAEPEVVILPGAASTRLLAVSGFVNFFVDNASIMSDVSSALG